MILNRLMRFVLVAALVFTIGCAFGKAMDRGDKYYETGDYSSALKSYEEALKIDPDSEEAQEKIARTRRKLVENYRQKAEQQLVAENYLGAIMTAHLAHRQLPQAKTTLDLVEKVSMESHRRAELFLEGGDYANATKIYETKVDRLPPVAKVSAERLQNARTEWASHLIVGGQEARREGRPADAMLHYAKAAQLTGDPRIIGERDRLRSRLQSEYAYVVVLQDQGTGFASAIVRGLRGLSAGTLSIFDQKDLGSRIPSAVGVVSMTEPEYRRERSTHIESQTYQSGTRQVENPFYQTRLNELEREENELLRVQEEVTRYENEVSRYQQQVAAEGPSDGISTSAEQGLRRANSNLERARDQLNYQRQDVQRAREALRREPPTKEEPVYSTLEYEVYTHTIIAESEIASSVQHTDGRPRVEEASKLSVSASDTEHRGYPVAGVSADPLNLPGERVLDEALFEDAVEWMANRVGESFTSWRNSLFSKGQRAGSDDQRVEHYVLYVLTNPQDVRTEVSTALASLRGIPDAALVIAQP